MAAAATAERVGDTHPFSKEYRSPTPHQRQQLLPNRKPSIVLSYDEAGSDSESDGEPNKGAESNENEGAPRPTKRKRPSSSYKRQIPKKRQHHLRQRSDQHYRPHSESFKHRPKSHSFLDQRSRVTAVLSPKYRLPSPTSSAPQVLDTEVTSEYPPGSDCCETSKSRSGGNSLITEQILFKWIGTQIS